MDHISVGCKLVFVNDIEVLKRFGIPIANAGLETTVIKVLGSNKDDTDKLLNLLVEDNDEKLKSKGPLWVIYGRHVNKYSESVGVKFSGRPLRSLFSRKV
jgi:hypothetical protein